MAGACTARGLRSVAVACSTTSGRVWRAVGPAPTPPDTPSAAREGLSPSSGVVEASRRLTCADVVGTYNKYDIHFLSYVNICTM